MHVRPGLFFVAATIAWTRLNAQDVWTTSTSITTQSLNSVCWGHDLFIAVGDAGTILTSADGMQWRACPIGTSAPLLAVSYGNGVFAAVGEGGTIVTSADGAVWTTRQSGTTQKLSGIGFADGHFAVAGQGVRITSTDGVQWSAIVAATSAAPRGMTYACGQFVLVGDAGTIHVSAEGRTYWSHSAGTSENLFGIAYGHRKFVAVGSNGVAFASSDGHSYKSAAATSRIDSSDLRGIAFFNGTFVAVGGNGTILVSPDSANWTQRASGSTRRLNAISANANLAVAVGDGGTVLRSEIVRRAPVILSSAENRIAYADTRFTSGDTIAFAVIASGTPPLSYQWQFAGQPIAGATDDILILQDLQGTAQSGDYTVTVANASGLTTGRVATLTVLGTRPVGGSQAPALIDSSFTPPVFESSPRAAVELRDGRILVGGAFDTILNGTIGSGLAILLANGSLDGTALVPGLNNGGRVEKLVAQRDGRILVLGEFTALNGVPRRNLARLLAPGSLDETFIPPATLPVPSAARLVPLANGGVLVAGTGDGTRIIRLNSDGSLDNSFAGGVMSQGAAATIKNAAVDSAGRVLVACVSASNQSFLARLLGDGRPDTSFSNFSFGSGADVPFLALGDNDRVLYVRVSATGKPSTGSLSAEGTADSWSQITMLTSDFRATAQADDRRLFLATWTTLGFSPTAIIARYRADGRSDESFEFFGKADGEIIGLAPLRDGRVLVFGSFNKIDGLSRPRLARLLSFNRAVSAPVIIAGVVPAAVTVREGEPFTLKMRAGNTPFGRADWVDERGTVVAGVPMNIAALNHTDTEFVRQAAGTYYIAGRISVNFSFSYSAFARIDVLPQAMPVILKQPELQTVAFHSSSGSFVVRAAGKDIKYQWLRNGVPIAGATSHIYDPLPTPDLYSNYTVTISNSNGAVTSAAVPLAAPSRFTNISVRASTANRDVLVVGFTVGGRVASGTMPVLVRAVGPTLVALGISGALPDPKLQLFSGSVPLLENDDWSGNADVSAVTPQVGAFALASATSKDAATFTTKTAGAYTVQIAGAGTDPGIVLGEIYDATCAADFATTPRLVNLSARTQVGTNSDILIAGFSIVGSTPKTVLVRGIGPTLASFNVSGVLADPKLDLFRAGVSSALSTNDNWGTTTNVTQVATTAANVGAFTLPAGSRDATLLITLAPGSYTAQVSGVNDTTGVALIEVYEVP